MDDRILDPDEAKERLAAWKGRVDRLAADTKAMSEQMRQLRLTVADPNHMVELTVDSSGALLGIEFSQRIKRVQVDELSRTVMETLHEAKRQLADRAGEIIESTLGVESEAGRGIAERVRGQLMPDENEGR